MQTVVALSTPLVPRLSYSPLSTFVSVLLKKDESNIGAVSGYQFIGTRHVFPRDFRLISRRDCCFVRSRHFSRLHYRRHRRRYRHYRRVSPRNSVHAILPMPQPPNSAPSDSMLAALQQQLDLLASLVAARETKRSTESRYLATLIYRLDRLEYSETYREDGDCGSAVVAAPVPIMFAARLPACVNAVLDAVVVVRCSTCVDAVLDAFVAARAPTLSATRPCTGIAARVADRGATRTAARVVNRGATRTAARVVDRDATRIATRVADRHDISADDRPDARAICCPDVPADIFDGNSRCLHRRLRRCRCRPSRRIRRLFYCR